MNPTIQIGGRINFHYFEVGIPIQMVGFNLNRDAQPSTVLWKFCRRIILRTIRSRLRQNLTGGHYEREGKGRYQNALHIFR